MNALSTLHLNTASMAKGLKYEKSINPNLQYTVQAQLVQQLISGISPFQWTRKKKKNSTALQHPSPIFWKRATNWDTWSFVWELLQHRPVQRRCSGEVVWWWKQRDVGTLHLTASLPEERGLWASVVARSPVDLCLLPVGIRCWCAGWRRSYKVLLRRVV